MGMRQTSGWIDVDGTDLPEDATWGISSAIIREEMK